MGDYKESTGNFWKPTKKGENLEGIYINKEAEPAGDTNALDHLSKPPFI